MRLVYRSHKFFANSGVYVRLFGKWCRVLRLWNL